MQTTMVLCTMLHLNEYREHRSYLAKYFHRDDHHGHGVIVAMQRSHCCPGLGPLLGEIGSTFNVLHSVKKWRTAVTVLESVQTCGQRRLLCCLPKLSLHGSPLP
jgi:hypothetical protein